MLDAERDPRAQRVPARGRDRLPVRDVPARRRARTLTLVAVTGRQGHPRPRAGALPRSPARWRSGRRGASWTGSAGCRSSAAASRRRGGRGVGVGARSTSSACSLVGLALLGAAPALRPALARRRRRDVPAGAPRARHVVRALRRRLRGDLGPPRLRAPLRATARRPAHALAATVARRRPFMLAGPRDLVPRAPRPEGDLPDLSAPGGRPGPPRRSARSCAARASWPPSRGRRELRRHGLRHEPAGYVAVGRGHQQGDVFTMISVHILGMYGLVLIVGDVVDRFGRARLVAGLTLRPSRTRPRLARRRRRMSLALLGLGLGWSFSYVAATTELVALSSPSERGRLVGFTDLCSRASPRPRSRFSAASSTPARRGRPLPGRARSRRSRPLAGRPARRRSPRARAARYNPAPADAWSAAFLYEDLQRQARRDRARLVRRRRRGPDPRAPRDPDRRHACAASASRSTRPTSTPATSSSS